MSDCTQQRYESISDFIDRIKDTFRDIYGYRRNHGFFKFRRGVQKKWLREGMLSRLWDLMHIDNDPTWEELVDAAQDAEWLYYLMNPKTWQPPVDYYNDGDFDVDHDDFAIVYTDGSCLRNGQPDAQAGIGVWFGKNHHL